MLRVKRFLFILALVVLAAVVVVFVLENLQPAQLTFLGWQSPQWPLVVFVSLAFILGGLIGLLMGIPVRARARVRMAGMRSEITRFRKENDALRDKSLTDHA
ncbi:lipopolysaccharide assembly protein LapA domain-containing protein [Pseudomonas sp. LA21]|uniref:lipopolysaccharide assembly protein LapA domain-containing protein n=1 Tax=unclassified Pseudomonas TaxID=196821 RepID=UPI001A9D6212|nr:MULTISPECIES: lipopolysaccharide assembly protein LapA domain-containing protein [unclassified Pseudomonas]MCJ1885107.1 lipopolysaccharide assembly protein LapA domain-containing protein [Pseudomonas sp. LA21]